MGFYIHLCEIIFKAEFSGNMLVPSVAGKAVRKTDPTGNGRASALAVLGLCVQLPKTWI